MILYKKLTEDQILEAIAHIIQEQLPEEIKNSDAEINVSFAENNSIDVYLLNLENNKN